MTMVLVCLTGQQTQPDLNPIENIWGCCQEENADERRPTVKEYLGFTPPQQCQQTDHLHARRIEAVIKAKGASTKYEYIYSKLTYFPEGQQFTKSVFIGLMKYSNWCRIGGFC